jgi:hypothetical protein
MRTRRIYHEDPEARIFEATVVSVRPGPDGATDVILDQTAFYPTGGGQPHDGGSLGGFRVIDVLEEEADIVHRVEGGPLSGRVTGEVDWTAFFRVAREKRLGVDRMIEREVGEDRIDHTPKDETLNVRIGSAFDVVCERKQTGFEKIAGSTYEFEYEITLRNHKTAPISVEVNEPVGGTWQMLASSHRWTKTAAAAAQFTVPVAVDGTSVLKYRVRVTF